MSPDIEHHQHTNERNPTMTTWDTTPEFRDNGLLPEGKQVLTIIGARERTTQAGNLQAALELEAPNGVRGEVTIPLEPWSFDADQLDTFRSKFRTDAAGLDFVPQNGDRSIDHIALDEFLPYAHMLMGARVNALVLHEVSEGKGRDGQPREFTNHRVRFRGLLSRPAQLRPVETTIDTSDFVTGKLAETV
jgi:hypothetical protein